MFTENFVVAVIDTGVTYEGVDQNLDGYGDGVLQQTFKPYEGPVRKADPTGWAYYF